MKAEGEEARPGCYVNKGSRFGEVAMPTEEAGLGGLSVGKERGY